MLAWCQGTFLQCDAQSRIGNLQLLYLQGGFSCVAQCQCPGKLLLLSEWSKVNVCFRYICLGSQCPLSSTQCGEVGEQCGSQWDFIFFRNLVTHIARKEYGCLCQSQVCQLVCVQCQHQCAGLFATQCVRHGLQSDVGWQVHQYGYVGGITRIDDVDLGRWPLSFVGIGKVHPVAVHPYIPHLVGVCFVVIVQSAHHMSAQGQVVGGVIGIGVYGYHFLEASQEAGIERGRDFSAFSGCYGRFCPLGHCAPTVGTCIGDVQWLVPTVGHSESYSDRLFPKYSPQVGFRTVEKGSWLCTGQAGIQG